MCVCAKWKKEIEMLLSLRIVTWIFLSFVAQYPNKWYLLFHKIWRTMACFLTVKTIFYSSTPASSLSPKGLVKLLWLNRSAGCYKKVRNSMPRAIFSFWHFVSVSNISGPSSQYRNVIYLIIFLYFTSIDHLVQYLLLSLNIKNKPKFSAAQQMLMVPSCITKF